MVNLGEIFDLVNLEPARRPRDARADELATTRTSPRCALEVPIACLTSGASDRSSAAGPRPACRAAASCRPTRPSTQPATESGAWSQVSRLGMPLVNEVVIGLQGQGPLQRQRARGRRAVRQLRHQPDAARAARDPVRPACRRRTLFPRTDLVAAFLTGVPGSTSLRTWRRARCCASTPRSRRDAGGAAEQPRRARRRQRRASPTAAAPATTWSTSSCAW